MNIKERKRRGTERARRDRERKEKEIYMYIYIRALRQLCHRVEIIRALEKDAR